MLRVTPLLLLLVCELAQAQVSHLVPTPVVTLDASKLSERVCYYQNQAYSFGAIIQVGSYYMECKAANDFETNGALKWQRLDAASKTH